MERDKTKTLRLAAGLVLLLSLALAALAAKSALLPPAPGGVAGAVTGAGAVLALAVFLASLWIFLLAKGLSPAPAPAASVRAAAPPPPMAAAAAAEPGAEALMLLSLLQEKGRLVDFAMEDIAAFSDERVGAVARVVHQGCRAVINEAFAPLPVAPAENARLTLEPGYDAEEFRLVGRAGSPPPYTVKVTHKGWRAQHVKLPRRLRDEKVLAKPIIAPAEVAA